MKSETPTPQPTTAQWAIDPALQQIPTTTAQTGTPAYYAPSYQYYYQQPQAQQARASSATPAASSAQKSGGGGSSLNTSDLATLNDALGSAGVDLRAEEESLQKSHDSQLSYRSFQDRTHTQPPNLAFNTHFLGTTVRAIAADTHKLGKPISDDVVNYLALALRIRLQDLIKSMIAASHHRTDTSFDRPASFYEDGDIAMWSIIVGKDVSKQLAIIEKVEKEEELKTRRERKERADMAAAQLAALQASSSGSIGSSFPSSDNMEEDGFGENPKKKRKKDGPGVTAKNMSEDVRKQMSNLVANQASGMGKKYAWMTASNANVAPRAKPQETTKAAASGPVTTTPRSTWSKPYVSATTKATKDSQENPAPLEEDDKTRLTMRDAMFVIEKERGHGGGRGAALGWT